MVRGCDYSVIQVEGSRLAEVVVTNIFLVKLRGLAWLLVLYACFIGYHSHSSASGRIVGAKDHASVQICIAEVS